MLDAALEIDTVLLTIGGNDLHFAATRGNLVVVGYPEIFPSSDETFHGCGG